jgi:hypothetical protein
LEGRLAVGRRVQQLEAVWKWRPGLAGGDDLGDDFQAAKQIGRTVGFGAAAVAVGQSNL